MSAARPKAAEKPKPSMGWSVLRKSTEPLPGGAPFAAAADRGPMVSAAAASSPTIVQRLDRARSVLIVSPRGLVSRKRSVRGRNYWESRQAGQGLSRNQRAGLDARLDGQLPGRSAMHRAWLASKFSEAVNRSR